MPAAPLATRRQFLEQAFAFSALALLGGKSYAASTPTVDPSADHMLLIGDWGANGSLRQQDAVAQSMISYVRRHQIKPGALFFLGDNFYGQLDGGVASPRWKSQFEDAYPKRVFDCSCYAILGNHDYYVEPAGKHDAQLAYAATPGTRWTMPGKWYRFEFPRKNPLVTFIALDSNFTRGRLGLTSGLTRSERAAQMAWLEAQLAEPRTTPYLAICAHHPLYSNGDHGDSRTMIALWDKHLRRSGAHFYMCGHDHDLQHLEFEGHPTSFVISGGGGARLRDLKLSSKKRGPFASCAAGFTHLEITRRQMVIRHIGLRGQTLHAFSKTPHGEVRLLQA